ncbi:MAG: glycosyltransferase [Clostridium sp.]|jgi:dolichol-phosphate mannosyltransferase|nr:glycosyltransferase [Clostridium sp.]
MTTKDSNFVSCILYLHNEEAKISSFLEQVCQVMENHFQKYEIICVNDGSTDRTVEEIQTYVKQSAQIPVLTLIQLSYYQGMEAAMNAGSDIAVGDFLFEFDHCKMDFAPELILEVYLRALQGYDVVAATPKRGIPLSSRLFYLVYNAGSQTRTPLRQERFRVITRRAVNRVNHMNRYIPYRKAMYMNCGLKTDAIMYENKSIPSCHKGREERDSRSLLAFDTFIIFTDLLEKLSMFLSFLFFAILLWMFGYLVYSIFSPDRPVEGWISTMGLMSLGFFMLFVMLTLIFKYLSVILNMLFRRQRYVVEEVEKLTK